MLNDDDRPRPKPVLFSAPSLDRLSAAESVEYIATLEAEIVRVKADMDRKKASRDAADSVFKK